MATQPNAIFASEMATQPNAIFAPKRATQPTAIFAPKLATQPATIFVAEKAVQPRAILPPEMATQPGEALISKIHLLGNSSLETRVKAIQPIADTGRCRQSSESRSMNDPIRNTRGVVSAAVASRAFSNSLRHAQTTEQLRLLSLNKALARVGLQLPASSYPVSRKELAGTKYLLNTPLQHALSEFIRRTRISLPAFVELVRGQTKSDYRPNKHLIPDVLARLCKGYRNLDKLQTIAAEGVRVELTVDKPTQENLPVNHGSAVERVNILRKNVCKEQDAWRCLVLDKDLLELWPEVFISSFGIVDKTGGDPPSTGRTIHDLSFPEDFSINDYTDQGSIPKPDYKHCDGVASEILRTKRNFPNCETKIMAGVVASAFRNVMIHSQSVHLFAGCIETKKALVIELACPFGWTGSPGEYEVIGGAIAFVHGSHCNRHNPDGFFNYHWVDDHINVSADIGNSCDDMDRSLRYAMTAILGGNAVNEEKITSWDTNQKVLGLLFDSVAETVSMPAAKISKALTLVSTAYHSRRLTRKQYGSLMGSLRHVATCVRSARPFLQRLRQKEFSLHRFSNVTK